MFDATRSLASCVAHCFSRLLLKQAYLAVAYPAPLSYLMLASAYSSPFSSWAQSSLISAYFCAVPSCEVPQNCLRLFGTCCCGTDGGPCGTAGSVRGAVQGAVPDPAPRAQEAGA
eukprot:2258436-Rhodomonas_salina.2